LAKAIFAVLIAYQLAEAGCNSFEYPPVTGGYKRVQEINWF